jgi:hypothetical protein
LVLIAAFALLWLAGSAHVATAADDDVVVDVIVAGDTQPGGVFTATADVTINDPTIMITGYEWTQTTGLEAVSLVGVNDPVVTVTLDSRAAFKAALLEFLEEPPIDEADLPPNVELPEGGFHGGLQDRFQVVAINALAYEEVPLVTLQVTVTTTAGEYEGEAGVAAWKVNGGIRDVPIGSGVLLHGKSQASYNWTLSPPAGSGAVLEDTLTQNPDFTPDVEGLYTATENESGVTIEVYAGTWRGVIVGQDEDGRPLVDEAACLGCHNDSGMPAPDMFAPWAQTGHAEIFTNNLNTSTHYGENCFGCHTVGFDATVPAVENGGIDDAADYEDFLDAGLLNNPGDNWTTMLAEYPDSASLANIQCENCHGPQDGNPHTAMSDDPVHLARNSISSDVCATCHGEPLRHARFQQWQLSKHANYELAVDEGDSGNCSRCHTANGFLSWLPALLDDDPSNNGSSVDVTWTSDEVHPQTCVTCHGPHQRQHAAAAGRVPGARRGAVRDVHDVPQLAPRAAERRHLRGNDRGRRCVARTARLGADRPAAG